MTDEEIRKRVAEQYAIQYPEWTDVRVTRIVESSLSGYLAVVRATDDGEETEGEICHVSPKGQVTPFSTTEELAGDLGRQIGRLWYEKLFSHQGISGTVTIVLLVTLCILAFTKDGMNSQVVQILGGAFLAAVGYLFGTAATRA